MSERLRHSLLLIAVLVLVLVPPGHSIPTQGQDGAVQRRVIVLGFDGVDPRRAREYMDAGYLPNLKKLADGGTFSPLATTNPAESPVSWAAFSIGANPGKSNIYDFLKRRPGSYIPQIALVKDEMFDVSETVRWGAPLGFGVVFALLPFLVAAMFNSLIKGKGGRSLPRYAFWAPSLVLGSLAAGSTHGILHYWVPDQLPRPVLAREGKPFWETAGEHGLNCCMIQVPVTFPAVPFANGELMTGLGTPDVLKTWGTHTVYASKFAEQWLDPVNTIDRTVELTGFGSSVTGSKLVHLELPEDEDEDGVVSVRTKIFGPSNFTLSEEYKRAHPEKPQDRSPDLTITVDRVKEQVSFEVVGAALTARPGEWTGWLPVRFEMNPIFVFRGLVRFYVRSVAPELYVYASPVNFHPAEPPLLVPLSAPFDYSREITERTGKLHETVGWAIATNPLKDELIDEDEFLEDMWFSFENRQRIIETELAREGWRIFTGVTLATDRVQHMFMRYLDPAHPIHEPDAPEKYKNAIREVYQAMDRLVGRVMEKYLADGKTDLFVISDHGFASFRKGVHVNSWLVENGFMTLVNPALRQRGNLNTLFEGLPASNVDWSRTTAYSMGLGKIYLNKRGREPLGIVEGPEEAEAIIASLIEKFGEFRDPESGERVVRKVYRSEELYSGPYVANSADLVIGFEEGYRVSWDTCLIEAPPGLIEKNRNKWSGDHCSVDPSLVPGFLVTNRKLTIDDPSIIDIARTVLGLMDVPPPDAMEGRNLLE